MRILIVSYEYPPLGGGGGVIVAATARAWVAAGHQVCVLTSLGPDLAAREVDQGVDIIRVAVLQRNALATASLPSLLSFPPAALAYALRHWARGQFDCVLSAFVVPSGLAGALLAARWRCPHVLWALGGDIYDPSKRLSPHRTPLLREVTWALLQQADGVITMSHDVAARIERFFGLAVPPVQIIPHGIALAPAPPARPAHAGPLRLVTVARLVRRKRLDGLLTALARLPNGTAQLTIVGAGPEAAALQAQAAALGLAAQVQFTGYVSDEERLAQLRAADAFVLVSEHEGFGIVYLEAAAQGLPLIAATVGGQTDFIRHGEHGWLVPCGAPAPLAAAIASLATQPALRAHMSQASSALAAQFRIERTAAHMLGVLDAIVRR